MNPEAKAYFAGMDDEEFFGANPSLKDGERWQRFAYWTIDEDVALSWDRDPNIVNWSFLEGKPHEFVESYFGRLEALRRAVAKDQLPEQPSPAELVQWFDANGTPSGAFFQKVKQHQEQQAETPRKSSTVTKERNKDLELIYGMAVSKYKYRRDNSTVNIAAKISADIKEFGFDVSEETIRNKLNDAHQLFGDKLKNPN